MSEKGPLTRVVGWITIILAGFTCVGGSILFKMVVLDGCPYMLVILYRVITNTIVGSVPLSCLRWNDIKETVTDVVVWMYFAVHLVCVYSSYYVLTILSDGNWASGTALGTLLSILHASFWLGQPVYWFHVICILFALPGMLMIVTPDMFFGGLDINIELTPWDYAVIFIFVNAQAVEFVVYALFQRPPAAVLFLDACFNLLFTGPIVYFTIGFHTPNLLHLSLAVAWALSQYVSTTFSILGGPKISVAEMSIIRAFDKVWGYFLGLFLLGEIIDVNSIVGSVLIFLSVIVMAYYTNQLHKEKAQKESVEDDLETETFQTDSSASSGSRDCSDNGCNMSSASSGSRGCSDNECNMDV